MLLFLGSAQLTACILCNNSYVWDGCLQKGLPLHSNSLGSGSHSPFLIHVDVLGPLSTSPSGQVNVTLVPSAVDVGSPLILMELLIAVCGRLAQPTATGYTTFTYETIDNIVGATDNLTFINFLMYTISILV